MDSITDRMIKNAAARGVNWARKLAQRLREMADTIERDADDVEALVENNDVPQAIARLSRVPNTMSWGVANAAMDTPVSVASEIVELYCLYMQEGNE